MKPYYYISKSGKKIHAKPPCIMGKINSRLSGNISELSGNISGLWGEIDSGLSGDISGLSGNISKLWGEINSGLSGEINSELWGEIDSGLWGEINSGLSGDISGLSGNITNAIGDISNFTDLDGPFICSKLQYLITIHNGSANIGCHFKTIADWLNVSLDDAQKMGLNSENYEPIRNLLKKFAK